MIRKPPSSAMEESRTIERVRDIAETTGRMGRGGARLGRKTGAFAGAGCLGWLGFGASMGALGTIANNAEHLFSLRGVFATLVILAIPAGLIALAIWQFNRARSI